MRNIYKKKAVAFVIVVAMIISTGVTVLSDWNPGDDYKMHFPQLPDEDGWDVYATTGLLGYPQVCLADDWNCSESGPVTDIHFWGSWLNGIEGVINYFTISIYTDIPATQDPDSYSKPGECLWSEDFYEWATIQIDSPYWKGWYNPITSEYIESDHNISYQYNIMNIMEPFYQEQGTIYWLSISANVQVELDPQPLWEIGRASCRERV